MHRIFIPILFIITPVFSGVNRAVGTEVTFRRDDKSQKINVFIGGKLFTSLLYSQIIEKPVLFPLFTSTGIEVTRGFPINPRSGERVDHPHQVGCWFNYGDVNGLDFWNNSYAISESQKPHYGSIKNVRIVKAEGGTGNGLLVFTCQWLSRQGEVLLEEETSMIFSGSDLYRKLIRITRLKASNGPVTFGDNKEGLFALRVDHAFETPSQTPEIYINSSGKPASDPVMNNEGVNGVFRSNEGKTGDDVWGTKASWVTLSASKSGEEISICLFDHPSNPGYPGYWHARGYGLFSVNNLGRKAFNSKENENSLRLKKGETVEFRHMIIIKTGGAITSAEMNHESDEFKLFDSYAETR